MNPTYQDAIEFLRVKAEAFRRAAKVQGRRVGPLAAGYEAAANELEASYPGSSEK